MAAFTSLVSTSLVAAANGTAPMNYSHYSRDFFTNITSPWDYISSFGNFWTHVVPTELFWAIIILIPYYTIYNRTRTIAIPAILYLFIGGALGTIMPTFLGQIYYWFLAVGGTTLVYDLYIGNQG